MNAIHDMLGAYCTDALDADERTAFEQHLAACDQCRAEAADLREVLAALADTHHVQPPRDLEDAVLARVRPGGSRQVGPVADPPATGVAAPGAGYGAVPASSLPVPSRRGAARWIAAAASGAVLFAAGVGLGRGQVPAESASPAPGMAAVVAVASAEDAHMLPVDIMGTTSHVVMSPEMDKAVFLASELPVPAKGMVYQVWCVSADGEMVSAGAFIPDPDGHIAVVLEGSTTGVDKFMITMEPPGGATHPSGEVLAEVRT